MALSARLRRILLLLTVTAVLASASYPGCAFAAGGDTAAETLTMATAEDREAETQKELAALFQKYKTLGACVCVIENGSVAYTFCYGTLSPDGGAVTADTLFRVGSISKMVAAMGVMKLIETGEAALDDDLSALLGLEVRNPQYPDTSVTLRQLMSHTAGLRDSGFYKLALRDNVKPLGELFSAKWAQYAFLTNVQAGTKMKYSNFGGGLLGVIIENLTGQTVDAYMTEAVFAPLGITAAYRGSLLPEDVTVSDTYKMPSGKLDTAVREDTAAITTPEPMLDYTLTAGKLTISAPDLARLLIVLCDGGLYGDTRVLTDASCTAMHTLQNKVGSVSCDSGWGLDMNILTDTLVEGRTLCGHGGKAAGMLCAAYFDQSDRTGVVMLTNGCNNKPEQDGIGMLSYLVIRQCYAGLIDAGHQTVDPWLVGG